MQGKGNHIATAPQDSVSSGTILHSGYLPTVAVVVPTYNRASFLIEVLESLIALDYPPNLLEIIVVDNSSIDDTEETVTKFQKKSPFPFHYFRKENRGPAVSRNYALERTQAEIVAFTDSDCIMGPSWIRSAIPYLQDGTGFVAGPVRGIIHPHHPVGFFSHQIFPEILKENFLYPTANIFYRREVVEQIGGFREVFGAYPWGSPVGGEDTDLAWRVKQAGYKSAFAQDAGVLHMASPVPPRSWLLDGVRAQVVPRLAANYPAIRREFFWGHFLSSFHVAYLLAMVGGIGALLTLNPVLLVLLVPYFREIPLELIAADVKSPKKWWRIPAKYVLLSVSMAVVIGALLYASIRYRSVVL